MWLTACGAIRAHWTNEIHDEWMRNVARDFGVSRNILERVRKLMDQAASDAIVTQYRKHESVFPNTHGKDRHVAAAALSARNRSSVDIVKIITWNLKDFDRKELAAVGIVAESPDTFLSRLLSESPDDVIAAFKRMRDNLRNPTKTTRECADTLATQGLKKFAAAITALLE